MKTFRSAVSGLVLLAAIFAALATSSTANAAETGTAADAAAVPSWCTSNGYANGRSRVTNNNNNGGGAALQVTLCWSAIGSGYYRAAVTFVVEDTEPGAYGATIRLEYNSPSGKHYWVPPEANRAWGHGDTGSGTFTTNGPLRDLYARACLTTHDPDNQATYCGPLT